VGDDLSGEGVSEDGLGADSCGAAPNSFLPSTPVTLASGKTEPISKVKPGDKVLATDLATGKTSSEPVLAVIRGHKTEHLVTLTIRVYVHGRWHSGTITATAGHLIYDLTRHGWITAGHLHQGDQLDTLTRGNAVVGAVHSFQPRDATVYNLTIGTDHTFYIATAGTAVLVHNCPAAGGTPGSETVSQVLKGKRGSIMRAPLPAGSPSWADIMNMTMNEIRAAAQANRPGFKTILKLLTDSRFNK
jgi:hypothetical protein